MNDIERRVAALEARHEISELRARYCWYITRAMLPELVALFTDDGVFENTRNAAAPPVRVCGRDELARFFQKTQAGRRTPMVANEVIHIGDSEAEGTCVMVSFGDDSFCGHYVDTFRKVDGRWLFSARRFRPYWPDYRPDPTHLHP